VCGDNRGRLVWADVLWEDASSTAPTDPHEPAIRDGEDALARRFAGVPAWFGWSTLTWWALAGPAGLVAASSAEELAGLLYRLREAGQLFNLPAPDEERQGGRRGWEPDAAPPAGRLSVAGPRRITMSRRILSVRISVISERLPALIVTV
jgi:hypothetical protein